MRHEVIKTTLEFISMKLTDAVPFGQCPTKFVFGNLPVPKKKVSRWLKCFLLGILYLIIGFFVAKFGYPKDKKMLKLLIVWPVLVLKKRMT